jgi:hypothetical protein
MPISQTTASGSPLDIVFGGPLLFVPTIQDGNITDLEVFSPRNGHPVGATFLPGVWFTDAELNDPRCERWPEPQSFSLLDPHSYAIDLTQTSEDQRPFPVSAIPETNHRVKPRRRLSGEWDVAISVIGHLSGWDSLRLQEVKEGVYRGSDAPKVGSTVSVMQRLSYQGVAGAEFCGASSEAKDYLDANVARGGTIIIEGEVPYQASLGHERQAVDAVSKLAGLDFHLTESAPRPHQTRLMNHVEYCTGAVILA